MRLDYRWILPALFVAVALAQDPATPERVQFNRDVRPILSDKCYTCHGPDAANRKTKLRFDMEAAAKADLGGRFAIVPGDSAHSEFVRRISSENKATRMPPVYSGASLTEREIAILKRWVDQGAHWQKHWAFIPPEWPDFPPVQNAKWPHNGIDYFVLSWLEREGLLPSPAADKATLIRRVTFDLTGLPPTLDEIDAFERDTSPDAYERVVDRLLKSPRYGERMAVWWLDAARYADTNGYQTDGERSMWRWRDWVIDAYNRNMPFDQFTVEQIAGDLLPNATLDQKIATGFNRNHRGNGEGGIVPEEYEVEYVVDRVDTTATVWLGLTLGCARCHDHKYDPLKQKEFYQVFAYFNNVPDKGLAWKFGNSPPFIPAPTPEQQTKLRALHEKRVAAETRFAALQPELIKAQREWEASPGATELVEWANVKDTAAYYPLDGKLASGVRMREGETHFTASPTGQAAEFDGKRFVDCGPVPDLGPYDAFSLAAWVYPTAKNGAIVSREKDDADGRGYSLRLKDGKVEMHLVVRWLDEAIHVRTETELPLNKWSHVSMVYDGSAVAKGVQIFIDGSPQKMNILLDELNQSFSVKDPLVIGAGGEPENRFRGNIGDVRVYLSGLTDDEVAALATSKPVNEILAIPHDQRSKGEAAKLARYYLENYAPERVLRAWREAVKTKKTEIRFLKTIPTVMVMQEREQPRDTFILARGAYDQPGAKVSQGVPAVLPPLPAGAPNNRLTFAKWLVDPGNPLTARVQVNRLWQTFFGTGLVKTVEDFGSQGEWPSNPELLDWLATEFMRSGWDTKSVIRTIVTSATYRQSVKGSPELIARDPENRLLARASRRRLPAESVRDQALAISGLLVEKIGGPSVKPYQPAGLWSELSGKEDYQQDHGANLYRRSIYTYWKRAVPPPVMMLFDSAGRETCTVRETRTDTPLQALTLMNDVTYFEAARVLAERMLTEGGTTAEARIDFAFRLATAHQPSPQKVALLLGSFHHYSDVYLTDPKAARSLLKAGEHPIAKDSDVSRLAAYTMIASMILNLDEVVTLN